MVPLLLLFILLPDVPEKDMNMLLLSAFGFLPIVILLFYVRFYVRIDGEGFHYKFFPVQWRWRSISANEIQSIDFQPTVSFIDRFTIGYRLNRFTNTLGMNITGKSFILLTLTNSKKVLIGTENNEMLTAALKRLTNPTEG